MNRVALLRFLAKLSPLLIIILVWALSDRLFPLVTAAGLTISPTSATITSGGSVGLTISYNTIYTTTISLSSTSGSVNPSSQTVNPPSGSFSATFTDTANSPPGTTITITARDTFGNSATSTVTIAGVPPPPPRTSVISGRVLLNGIGLGGVVCTLDGGTSTTTALDGTYSFSGVGSGSHSVFCNPPRGAQTAPNTSNPVTVNVSGGTNVSAVTIYFVTSTPPPPPKTEQLIVTAGCTSIPVKGSCPVTVQFNGSGAEAIQRVIQLTATLGTLSQTSFPLNGRQQIFTATYTAGNTPGTATITATDSAHIASPGSTTIEITSSPSGPGISHCRGLTLRLSNGQTVFITIAPNSVLPDTCNIDVLINSISVPGSLPNGGSVIETMVIIAKDRSGKIIHVSPDQLTMTITLSPLPVTLASAPVSPASQGFGGLATLFMPTVAEAAGPGLVIAASSITVFQQTATAKSAVSFVTVPSSVSTAKQAVTFTTSSPFNGPFIISGTAIASGTSSGQNAPAPAQSAPAQGGGVVQTTSGTLPATGHAWNPLDSFFLCLLIFTAGLILRRHFTTGKHDDQS